MPLILPGNVGSATAATGFNVANSCRFDGSSSYMSITPGSNMNLLRWTWSSWIKRGGQAGEQNIFCANNAASDYQNLMINANGEINFLNYVSNNVKGRKGTTRRLRDSSAWYHIVCVWDSANSTANDRMQIYVNGVRETAFGDNDNPDVNQVGQLGESGVATLVGTFVGTSAAFWNGYMAEVVLIDGLALTPTSFGEFDEDSGIWKPIDVSGLTFGTHGFYLDFEASDNLGNDANGGTDLTESGLAATDQSTDTCTNNFATLNPLFPEANVAYAEGNTRVTADGSANWSSVISTIGLATGKWYWEWKATSSSNAFAGIASEVLVNSTLISDGTPYDQDGLILYFTTGRRTIDGADTESHFTAWSSGTMSAALDLDSGTRTITFYHNGSATGDVVNLTANFAAAGDVFPVFMVNAGSNPSIQNPNFGNPNTANSSDAADGNGYGAFEYAPPSGYLAICTKNLSEASS